MINLNDPDKIEFVGAARKFACIKSRRKEINNSISLFLTAVSAVLSAIVTY